MFKKILAGLSFTVATFAPSVSASGLPSAHYNLVVTAQRAGFNVVVNTPVCDEDDNNYGFYRRGTVTICQTNVYKGYRGINDWNSEDLDTLRHEIHHAVQDCLVGDKFDSELGYVYSYPYAYANRIIGDKGIRAVQNAYDDADYHTQVLEIEAFAVAAENNPDEQARDLAKYCM